MTLGELLAGFDLLESAAPPEISIHHITCDSRDIRTCTLFVALKGAEGNGHQYLSEVVEKGVKAVICEQKPKSASPDVVWIQVSDTQALFSPIVKRFYGDPASRLKIFGITGTNGKTTIVHLLDHVIRSTVDPKALMMGTVEVRLGGKKIQSSLNTTPGLLDTVRLMERAVRDGASTAVMEVSSHGLVQGRLEGFEFESVIFTNLTQDHLDYHKSFEDYFLAKQKLFTEFESKTKIVNQDDRFGQRLIGELRKRDQLVITTSLQGEADSWASEIQTNLEGSSFLWHFKGESVSISTRLSCEYNVSNVLLALTAARIEGIETEQVVRAVSTFLGVLGRLEGVETLPDQPRVFVDYAHTPDAVLNVCKSIRQIHPASRGRLLTVFGCGGDRDRKKRPLMAEAAQDYSDKIYITSDNPRTEDPEKILDDIASALTKPFQRIQDRKAAIESALGEASPEDVVLILGKGHEDYQILGSNKVPFSDKGVVQAWLENKQQVRSGR